MPAILIEAADRDAAEMAIIENIQREDLNVIEEAEGYRELADKFGLKQDEIAKRVGKARTSVANTLRLLDLPDTALIDLLLGRSEPDGNLDDPHARRMLDRLRAA